MAVCDPGREASAGSILPMPASQTSSLLEWRAHKRLLCKPPVRGTMHDGRCLSPPRRPAWALHRGTSRKSGLASGDTHLTSAAGVSQASFNTSPEQDSKDTTQSMSWWEGLGGVSDHLQPAPFPNQRQTRTVRTCVLTETFLSVVLCLRKTRGENGKCPIPRVLASV